LQANKQAAACCVEVCDVGDTTIIAIWKNIYSFLDTKDIISGMLVCKSFCKELPSFVSARGQAAHLADLKHPVTSSACLLVLIIRVRRPDALKGLL
jgi:hypothetical protein